MERQKDFSVPDDDTPPIDLADFLVKLNQGLTRQSVADQDLLDEKSAGSKGEEPLVEANSLATELYKLLDQRGTEGVKAQVREIFSRPGADMQNFRANAALTEAVRHFRSEAQRDPCGKAAAILKIIEETMSLRA